ncbi:MAG: hypothetical protein R3A52_03100 [Polyangiales bacterium]
MIAKAALGLSLCVALGGCATATTGPRDAVRAYADALRDRRWSDAWRTLSAETRRALPYEEFERLAREHPEAVRDAVQSLDRVETGGAVTARMELPDGSEVVLRYEDGAWRVDPGSLTFYPQRTPRQALRSFARAVELQRWEVVLQLAPRRVVERLERAAREASERAGGRPTTAADRLREAWTGAESERVAELLGELRGALDRGATIESLGDRATMIYGQAGRYTARLVREGGLWRVEDPG